MLADLHSAASSAVSHTAIEAGMVMGMVQAKA
jgi:hypothetical protein